jgi:hypothetical protein
MDNPDISNPSESFERRHLYQYLGHLASHKAVLDLSCGEGQGAEYLALQSRHVTGADINWQAISRARLNYQRDNLDFIVRSWDRIPVEGRALFDLVVWLDASAELKERDWEGGLAEVKRVLKPDGLLAIGGFANPFFKRPAACREGAPDQESAQGGSRLERDFRYVELLDQQTGPGSYIRPRTRDGQPLRQLPFNPVGPGPVQGSIVQNNVYCLAICSNSNLPVLPDSMAVDLSGQAFRQKDEQLRKARQENLRLEKSREELSRQMVEMQSTLTWPIVNGLRRINRVLVPGGGLREKALRRLWQGFRIWRQHGWRVFLKSCVGRPQSQKGESPSLSDGVELAASNYFDRAWYVAQYPQWQASGLDPWQHYLKTGARSGCNPGPLFNTNIYVKAQNGQVSPEKALLHFYRSNLPLAPGAYRNADVLTSIQQSYLAETETRCLKEFSQPRQKTAVFLQCGSGSVHPEWLTERPKPWDLIVNHYDRSHPGRVPCNAEFVQTGRYPGTKITWLYYLLSQRPALIANYDYIMLLDDDVLIKENDISTTFEIMQAHNLDLGQPSLSLDSFCSHPALRNQGTAGLRYINYVEIMLPVISKRALAAGRHLFGQSISGWGVDLALGKIVAEQFQGRAAVMDGVSGVHARTSDVENGGFYKMLKAAHLYPEIELANLLRLYQVTGSTIKEKTVGIENPAGSQDRIKQRI